MVASTGNPYVDTVGTLSVSGNVIPNTWFDAPQFKNKKTGKTFALAALVMSEVVYWYRPVEIRDKDTFQTIGWRTKFEADKWQASYAALADKFGFSKWQVTEACHHLEDVGLITLEFRTIVVGGTVLNNVLYIAPVLKEVVRLMTPPSNSPGTPLQKFGTPSPKNLGDPPLKIQGTNTEIPTEIPTETSQKGGVLSHAGQNTVKLDDVLKQQKQKQQAKHESGKIPLGVRWKKSVALVCGGFQKALTMKEAGQLKMVEKSIGETAGAVVSHAVDKWQTFAMKAKFAKGLDTIPGQPNVGFFLAHHEVAVGMLQPAATVEKPIGPPKKPPVLVGGAPDMPKEQPYKPTPEELEKLKKEFGL